MANPFFIQGNRDYVYELCKEFLADKYNIEMHADELKKLLFKQMNIVFEHFKQNPPMPSVAELNKRVIIQAKQEILATGVATGAIAATAAQASPSQIKELPPTPVSDSGEDTEDAFMKKVQELELARNAHVAVAPALPQETIANIHQSAAPPPALLPSMPAAGPTVLYVPTTVNTVKSSRSIAIFAHDRLWDYFHDRFAFGWAGPIPAVPEGMTGSLELSGVLLPSVVASQTPVVQLRIEGVGEHSQTFFCIRNSGGSGGWDTWKPVSPHIKALACPWSIQVLDALGEPLQIGADGFHVQECDESFHKGRTRIVLSESDVAPKDSVLMWRDKEGRLYRSKVLQHADHVIDIHGVHKLPPGTPCGLWNMQPSILIELKLENMAKN